MTKQPASVQNHNPCICSKIVNQGEFCFSMNAGVTTWKSNSLRHIYNNTNTILLTRSKHNSVEKFGVFKLWSMCTNFAQKIASLAVKTHLGNIHNCRSWVTDSFFEDSTTKIKRFSTKKHAQQKEKWSTTNFNMVTKTHSTVSNYLVHVSTIPSLFVYVVLVLVAHLSVSQLRLDIFPFLFSSYLPSSKLQLHPLLPRWSQYTEKVWD